ncbi:hypothetical protein PC114_g20909 [Phytophthora cactorum]|uniref:Uncharacterized protein n=1 Tax=Phytophthora cactorum TaxID=29920 RepID=A0A8T1BNU3_9STRA|nr:hypothetical protein PC114_g20909 [Phytophthora cactorum]KAG2905754.1 hypothetical protein PC117_g20677 [Phytophthora cactorum]
MVGIDKWKDQFGHLTYAQFIKSFPATYKASEDGTCSFKALRIACHVGCDSSIVPLLLIDGFEATQEQDAAKEGKTLDEGVSMGDDKVFLAFLRSHRAPLACNVFGKYQLDRSITSFEGLCQFKLDPGANVA